MYVCEFVFSVIFVLIFNLYVLGIRDGMLSCPVFEAMGVLLLLCRPLYTAVQTDNKQRGLSPQTDISSHSLSLFHIQKYHKTLETCVSQSKKCGCVMM